MRRSKVVAIVSSDLRHRSLLRENQDGIASVELAEHFPEAFCRESKFSFKVS